MLSIGVMDSGQQTYYLSLARDDYYLEGGEPPGIWHGKGAEALGLTGIVDGDQLTQLFEGFDPRDQKPLVEIQNGKHRPGWDLTFSAPKSVSVLWGLSDEDTQRKIQEAHFQAVKASLDYLESHCAVARRGKAGMYKEIGSLIFATFEHGTSRALDPQLHTHVLLLNAVMRQDDSFGTVNAESVFKSKMLLGALYRAEFAKLLELSLGVAIERIDNLFEIAGVPKDIRDEFSKRRAEIEAVLDEKGWHSAEAAAKVAFSTRSAKEHASRNELFPSWRKVGEERGWSQDKKMELFDLQRNESRDSIKETAQALAAATARVSEQQSYFSERDFTRRLAESGPGRGMGISEVLEATAAYLDSSPEIIPLGRLRREALYTTQEIKRMESSIFETVEKSKETHHAGVSETTLRGVIASRPQKLSAQQENALRHITEETELGGSIKVISGMAGTGKTTLLKAARLAWQLEGYEVKGAALSGKAAKGLADGADIESQTIHKLLWDYKRGRFSLHKKSVLVIDEAGMVGTRQLATLINVVKEAGSKLVLVGDERQIQPIEAGGMFVELKRLLQGAELSEIIRQNAEWAKKAVHDFADGNADEGLNAHAERGLFHVDKDEKEARAALICQWKVGGIREPKEQLIFTGTHHDRVILNRMAQAERMKAGVLSDESLQINDDRFHVGDRILFGKNSNPIGVVNGSLGEVIDMDLVRQSLSVRLDEGVITRFSARDYGHVKLGYAMTTNGGQGATVDRAFVMVGGTMTDREISYVQVSRARDDTHIFANLATGGDELGKLVRQMSESRAKETAHSVAQRIQSEASLKHSPEQTSLQSEGLTF